MTKIAFFAVSFLISSSAHAQVDFGTAVGPEVLPYGESRPKREPRATMTPLALAASLAFDATTWATINVSTSDSPAQGLFRMQQKGYYKLEIFQLLTIARRSGFAVQKLVDERDKGAPLRDIAKRHGVDFDVAYEESLELQLRVENQLMPTIMTVSVSTVPISATVPPRKRDR